jgi:hypothetical protein
MMLKIVHLEPKDMEQVFEKVQRPPGTPETFTSDWPYEINMINYKPDKDDFTFSATGTITKTDEVCPDAVKAAHLKQMFEETMVAILRHSGEAGISQWVPHLKATITTKAKIPPGKIDFFGHIWITRRENKGPVIHLECQVNPYVTYEFEGRIINNPSLEDAKI